MQLDQFFEKYLKKESIFLSKQVLQSAYVPSELLHRDQQLNQVANILAPALKMEKPSNLFIYGKTGTGKTLTIKFVMEKMLSVAEQQNIQLKILYLNCKLKKVSDTEYRLIAQLSRLFGKEIPPTGLPTDEVYGIFFKAVDSQEQNVVLVLDEIDQLCVNGAGNDVIYNLTRINSELKRAQISIVGVSNSLSFANNLDPRVKSSLSEEELVFPPYNALQILDILKNRSEKAFRPAAISEGVLQKCAAYAAREHGDARRALELLRVAGELAERKGLLKVSLEELDEAEDKIEKDRVLDMVLTQPKQFQATLYAILLLGEKNPDKIFTGEVYEVYKSICSKTGLRPLTQRRVSDILAELDMLGVINAKVISKGRFGRTREIRLSIPSPLEGKVRKIVEEDLGLEKSDQGPTANTN
ncbi:MAG: ORC1-type DNA replication protein [Nanoarchaeota archaeon]